MVMFPANLGAVPPPCHPLCQPQGGEDSSSASKWMVCVCARVFVCAQESECQKKLASKCRPVCLHVWLWQKRSVEEHARTTVGVCLKKKKIVRTLVFVFEWNTQTHTREGKKEEDKSSTSSAVHFTPPPPYNSNDIKKMTRHLYCIFFHKCPVIIVGAEKFYTSLGWHYQL